MLELAILTLLILSDYDQTFIADLFPPERAESPSKECIDEIATQSCEVSLIIASTMCIIMTLCVFEQVGTLADSTEIWSDEDMWSDHVEYQSNESNSSDSRNISALLKLYTFFLLMFQTLFRLSGTAINVLFSFFALFFATFLTLYQLFLTLLFQSFQERNMLLAQTEVVVEPSFSMFVALLVTAYTSGTNALFALVMINLCQESVLLKGFPIIHNFIIAIHVFKL